MVAAAWRRHAMKKRARLQLRMLRDARDMKQVVPSSRTSRIANLKKLPLTERGLKSHVPVPSQAGKTREADAKTAAAAAANAAPITTTSTGRAAIPVKAPEKQKHATRHTPHVAPARQGGGVGVGIVFAHDALGGDDVLSVKQFVK